MTRTHKILIGIAVGMFLLVGGVAFAVQQVITRNGLLVIDVTEKAPAGCKVRLVMPAVLVNLCSSAIPLAIPAEERDHMRAELERFGPVIESAIEEFNAAPDMTFVEIESRDEHVTISKEDGQIVIDVETDDEDVHVSMPVASLEHAWQQIY